MPLKPIVAHNVQLFVLVKGKLAAGNIVDCKSPADACRVAEEKVRVGRAIGAAAFTRTVVDPDYDDGGEPVTLAIFGRVPPGVADQLPF
ncbi:hypothetical protein [Methylobacterium pseudosasicola]|uniref:Uncharacterized protein n=1 Tax=Methylobacterium pseudosasicola TaxID=582667 RepID=A0A1I4UR77_9HYPH|nr:hypothetical protein [Methylobacterium pseudosasicola]SFM91489.1 hypothetical protein SAMN05192568_107518 [Methylobacterium pseudosasicola]